MLLRVGSVLSQVCTVSRCAFDIPPLPRSPSTPTSNHVVSSILRLGASVTHRRKSLLLAQHALLGFCKAQNSAIEDCAEASLLSSAGIYHVALRTTLEEATAEQLAPRLEAGDSVQFVVPTGTSTTVTVVGIDPS